jgi:hypothetical protein
VRFALGKDAEHVRFLDMAAIGRNPACIIPQWQEFLEAHPGDGPLRGVGEPVWDGRRDPELEECRLHEALLNLAFTGGRPWQLLCPYDVASLPVDTVADALRTHPIVGRWPGRPSEAYAGLGAARAEFARPLPPPPPDATEVLFGQEDLAALRGVVRRHVEVAGLDTEGLSEFRSKRPDTPSLIGWAGRVDDDRNTAEHVCIGGGGREAAEGDGERQPRRAAAARGLGPALCGGT